MFVVRVGWWESGVEEWTPRHKGQYTASYGLVYSPSMLMGSSPPHPCGRSVRSCDWSVGAQVSGQRSSFAGGLRDRDGLGERSAAAAVVGRCPVLALCGFADGGETGVMLSGRWCGANRIAGDGARTEPGSLANGEFGPGAKSRPGNGVSGRGRVDVGELATNAELCDDELVVGVEVGASLRVGDGRSGVLPLVSGVPVAIAVALLVPSGAARTP